MVCVSKPLHAGVTSGRSGGISRRIAVILGLIRGKLGVTGVIFGLICVILGVIGVLLRVIGVIFARIGVMSGGIGGVLEVLRKGDGTDTISESGGSSLGLFKDPYEATIIGAGAIPPGVP